MDEDIEIGCPIHGSFWMTPRCHLDGHGCPDCMKEDDLYLDLIADQEIGIKYKLKNGTISIEDAYVLLKDNVKVINQSNIEGDIND